MARGYLNLCGVIRFFKAAPPTEIFLDVLQALQSDRWGPYDFRGYNRDLELRIQYEM